MRFHITEHRNFFTNGIGHRLVHARYDNVGENAHTLQFFYGMLRGFALEFARTGNVRNQRDVDKAAVISADFARNLTNRL